MAVPVESLVYDANNTKLHPEENLAAIEASFRQFGQDQVIVFNQKTRHIIKGNGRVEVARRMGWKWLAALPIAEDEIDSAARGLADNRTSELGIWDHTILGRLLSKVVPDRKLVEQMRLTLSALADDQGIDTSAADPAAVYVAPEQDTATNYQQGKTPSEALETFLASSDRKLVVMIPIRNAAAVNDSVTAIFESQRFATTGQVLIWLAEKYAKKHRVRV